MSRPVPPSGPLDAELVFVGRDPGFEESQRGVPFVGMAGRLLDRALSAVGIPRERCLITNVVDVQPRGNKWELHDPADVARGVRSLRALLGRHPRKVIVALGNEAFTACRGLNPWSESAGPITELRGYRFGNVLPTVHPAFIVRAWHPWWALFQWDLQKAKRLLHGGVGGEVSKPLGRLGRTEDYCTLLGDARGVAVLAEAEPVLGIDIETAESGAPVCVGVGFPGHGVTLPLPAFAKQVQQILHLTNRKVFHNAQFDLTLLGRAGYTVNGPIGDTMLAWHTLEPMLAGKTEAGTRSEKSLRVLASLLLDEEWWKDYDFHSEEERWLLCAKDARVTLACWTLLQARLHATGAVR